MLLESYCRAPSPSETSPRHLHEEYQLTLSLSHTGEYYYRGASHPVPVGSLSVIHPGEVHWTCPPAVRPTHTRFRVMYVPAATMQKAAAAVTGRDVGLPFFAEPTLYNSNLADRVLKLHQDLGNASQLESESRLLITLTHLIANYTACSASVTLGSERAAIRRVREYLQENYAQNISLEELAGLADLSAFHLIRVFVKEVGLSPHVYQTQVRIARAKALLIEDLPSAQVAIETGFCDQSHLGRHFKRLVGVTPRSYAGDRIKGLRSQKSSR